MVIVELIIIFIFMLIMIVVAPHFPNKKLRELRAAAKRQLMEYRNQSTDPRFQFDGRAAEIIWTTEDIARSEQIILSYSWTCYARNQAGEYFMFVSNENSPPFFKHVEQTIAKIALGKNYIA